MAGSVRNVESISNNYEATQEIPFMRTPRILSALLSLAILLFGVSDAWADPRLKERAEQLTVSLQKERSQVAVLGFVDWDKTFQEVDADRRVQLGLTTPESLRSHIKKIVQDPVRTFETQFEKSLVGYGTEQRELMREVFQARSAELRAQWQQSQSEVFKDAYSVRSVQVDPLDKDRARVVLSTVGSPDTTPLSFDFEKRAEEWYVATSIARVALESLRIN